LFLSAPPKLFDFVMLGFATIERRIRFNFAALGRIYRTISSDNILSSVFA